jgi:hypothetical protein
MAQVREENLNLYDVPIGPTDDELYEKELTRMCGLANVERATLSEPFFVGPLSRPFYVKQGHAYICRYGRLDGGKEIELIHFSASALFAVWSKMKFPVTLRMLNDALWDRVLYLNRLESDVVDRINRARFLARQLSFVPNSTLASLSTEDMLNEYVSKDLNERLYLQLPEDYIVSSFQMTVVEKERVAAMKYPKLQRRGWDAPLYKYDIQFTNGSRLLLEDVHMSSYN